MNGIWRNDTVTYEGLQEPPPVATALLFLGWEGGSKLQHREPQTRRTSGSRAAKSPASSELLAYPWRWLALACSCHTAYVRTSLGMAPTIPYCQILLRAGGRVGVLDSGCSFTEWHPRAPCQVALLRSTEPLRQSLLTAGLSLADSTHLERYTHKRVTSAHLASLQLSQRLFVSPFFKACRQRQGYPSIHCSPLCCVLEGMIST